MRHFLLLTFAAAFVLAASAAADESVTHPFSASIARTTVRRVIVDIPAGEIAVRNGPADHIRISGEVHREYEGPRERDEQQRIVNDIAAEIFVNGQDALIRR